LSSAIRLFVAVFELRRAERRPQIIGEILEQDRRDVHRQAFAGPDGRSCCLASAVNNKTRAHLPAFST